MNPLVSIVTVTYNSADTLQETIDSVRRQTYGNIEYIVVDGESTDDTLDIIRSNADIVDRCISEPDEGIYDAMNKGIRVAGGELIGILNSDDLYLPHTVAYAAEAYQKAGEPCVVYGNMVKFDGDGNETYHEGDLTDEAFEELDLQLNHPTCFVSQTVYERHGCFDTWFKIGADRELMLRLQNAGIPRFYINKTLARFRLGGATSRSTLSDAFWLTWQNWVMYRRHGIPVGRALQRVAYVFFRRLAKSILSLEKLRRVKARLLKILGVQTIHENREPDSTTTA